MVCKLCNFDNKDGVMYCENCGNQLASKTDLHEQQQDVDNEEIVGNTVLLDEVVTDKNTPDNNDSDESEADTTVLTSEMDIATGIPMGFGMQMQSATSAQPGMQMQSGKLTQPGMQMQSGKLTQPGMQAQSGSILNDGTTFQPGMQANAQKSKSQKENDISKSSKEKKIGKLGTGIKVYIALSALAIVGLAGVMIYGCIDYNKKIDQLEIENNDKQTEIDDYVDQVADKDSQISDLELQVTTLNENLQALDELIANYETQIGDLEGKQEEYSSYDSLIAFANGSNGQGYSDMFCSDTLLHIKKGESVDVRVYYPSSEGKLTCAGNDNAIATCELSEEKENGVVATVKVTAVASGNTTITISNDQNDEKINIYVYVD